VAARDVFDLYVLSTHPGVADGEATLGIDREQLEAALERTYSVHYERYRDTVADYLEAEDRASYERRETWDEIRLLVVSLIERGLGRET
jgi:hypothetical protein